VDLGEGRRIAVLICDVCGENNANTDISTGQRMIPCWGNKRVAIQVDGLDVVFEGEIVRRLALADERRDLCPACVKQVNDAHDALARKLLTVAIDGLGDIAKLGAATG